ncbi:hypothetical protein CAUPRSCDRAFT_11854 [Caulochytrium protostelioides]|uniref:Uncharacterized protein n=1 Tax=Caulochytrium protostelioides TaxID=1555241 RepID=A0A4P9WVD1_9FUNG|nr:hypothetical protein CAUPRSCDRAFT_11854 [Caulochytrium protostelioides]
MAMATSLCRDDALGVLVARGAHVDVPADAVHANSRGGGRTRGHGCAAAMHRRCVAPAAVARAAAAAIVAGRAVAGSVVWGTGRCKWKDIDVAGIGVTEQVSPLSSLATIEEIDALSIPSVMVRVCEAILREGCEALRRDDCEVVPRAAMASPTWLMVSASCDGCEGSRFCDAGAMCLPPPEQYDRLRRACPAACRRSRVSRPFVPPGLIPRLLPIPCRTSAAVPAMAQPQPSQPFTDQFDDFDFESWPMTEVDDDVEDPADASLWDLDGGLTAIHGPDGIMNTNDPFVRRLRDELLGLQQQNHAN